MELQIQDLVTSIKKEGVEEAKKEASKIIAEAKKQADEIVLKAKEQAKKAVSDAEKEINVLKESAKVSAQQALRDASITFKKEVQKVFKKILAEKTDKKLSSDTLSKLIIAALGEEKPSDYKLEINELSDSLKSELASLIEKGLEIKVVKNAPKGFKLAAKDNSGFFDLSEDELVQILSNFVGEIKI